MTTGARQKRGICGICPAGCWIKATYDGQGRIAKVEPDDDPDMGITCKLAEHARDIIYSPDRVLHPLKRKGPKGTYEFERVTWDHAYEEIASRLERIKEESGPRAAAVYTGVGCFEQAFCDVFQPAGVAVSSASSVLFPFGSPNAMGVGALCYVSYGMIAPHLVTGKMLIDMFNDVENSELIVVWGANPSTDLPPIDMKRILDARRRGAEVVVIDPRRTMTAKLTDARWVPLRPGTDGALALGLCNVLIEEELFDRDLVRDWTLGFDDFSAYVQQFHPKAVEEATGVDPETVVWLARRLASARGASQYMYTGLEYSNSGVQAIRASLVLWALAGQLDVPGGRCFTMEGSRFPINRDGLVASPNGARKLGSDRFPVYARYRDESHAMALPDAVLSGKPYPVRALIIQGSSMITSWPEPERWRKTFEALDFLVCIDRHLTADAAYADLVLPACTYFETDSYVTYGPVLRLREKMIEPLGESRSDLRITAELAERLGYGHLYPQSSEELYEYILAVSDFTIEEVRRAGGAVSVGTELMQYRKWEKGLLRADGRPGFDTPSGKLEIHSRILEDYGYAPLPRYVEPAEGPASRPDIAGQYPLVFNSGARVRTSFHTQHHGVPGLAKERPEPGVTMNKDDAGKRGIGQGDLVRISTPRGSVTMRAIVSDDIAPGCIEANHACGSPVGPKAWSSRNVNDLTDLDNHDPVSGFPVYKCLLCEVEKERDGGEKVVIDSGELGEDDLDAKGGNEKMHDIYFDNNATTPMSDEVIQAMQDCMAEYGNPSSIHSRGSKAKSLLDDARRKVGGAISCPPGRLVFTGCGSESNNLAIKGTAFREWDNKPHFITSMIEHASVLKAMEWLGGNGFEVTYLAPDNQGLIDPGEFEKAIKARTVLASIMLANNETGAIQPVPELSRIARDKGVLFHCDAVQAMGKVAVDVAGLGADMVSLAAHKFYGPKGIGALYAGKGVDLEPIISGGGQERGLRSGTENVVGIAGLGKAAESVPGCLAEMERVRGLRDRLEERLLSLVKGNFVNGHPERRLPNTINITLPGIRGESMVNALGRRGIFVSSGSACKAGSTKPSGTLLAMGLSEEQAHCALRISLGVSATAEDVENTARAFGEIISQSRNAVHFAPCR